MGKALEPALRTKQASHLTPESEEKGAPELRLAHVLFPKLAAGGTGCQGLGKPPCLGGEL